jgi:uncharacterized RDD family membrane protein YckC
MTDSTQNPPPEDPSGYTPPPAPGGYQPAPPPAPAPSGVGQPADLLNRFLARLIDMVLVGVVNAIVVSVVVVGAIMGSSSGAFGYGMGGGFLAGAVYSILTAAIALGYFAFLESKNGQTLGKMILKLQTRGTGGGNPTMTEAVKRNLWVALPALGIVPIIGGLIGSLGELVAVIMIAVTINNSPTRQGWHDDFADGTSVIKIG